MYNVPNNYPFPDRERIIRPQVQCPNYIPCRCEPLVMATIIAVLHARGGRFQDAFISNTIMIREVDRLTNGPKFSS